MAVLKLPTEIEMDILSRLPVESLVPFRCVSKSSRSLISDTHFVKLHLNRSILSKNSQKIFCASFPPKSIDYESFLGRNNKNNAIVKLDCPLWSQNRIASVIGSCNGLICYVVDLFNVVIYNPSTRISKELPEPPGSSSSRSNPPIHLNHYYYGFGFDSSENDYKVVLGCDIIDDGYKSIRFHVFSLRHNSWRRIQDLSLSHLGRFSVHSKGVFLNGALHWLLIPIGIDSEELHRVIVSFDLSKEVFSEMSLDIIQGRTDFSFHTLGAFEECLYAAGFGNRFSANEYECYVEVWLMKEYGVKASWTKFITIPCIVGTYIAPVCFLRNRELLLKIDRRKLGSYNTKENTLTKICDCSNFSKSVLYVESLVSPNSIDGNDKQLQALGPIAVTLCCLPHSCGKKARMMV